MYDSTPNTSLYKNIYRQLHGAIVSGRIPAGSRLPSLRQLAKDQEVSRITVATAYRELQLEGLIETRERSGTFVADLPKKRASACVTRPKEPPVETRISWERRLRQSADPVREHMLSGILGAMTIPDTIPFCWGAGDPLLFPIDNFRIIINRVLRIHGLAAAGAESTEGFSGLRTALAEYLHRLGIQVEADGLIVTTGSQQAITLVAEALLRPGDKVVLETPTWPGAIEAFVAQGARLLPIPVDRGGMQVKALGTLLGQERPKLIYTVPTFHNPTGAVMSLERRQYLIQKASEFGVPILEDDALREVRFGSPTPPPLAALDPSGNVINVGSFTKSLLPAARIGYLVGPKPLLECAVSRKRWIDMFCSPLMQHALAAYLKSGEAVDYWKRISRAYAKRQYAMLEALSQYFPQEAAWHEVDGGPQLWVRLPDDVSVRRLCTDALKAGVSFAPGEAFFPEPDNQHFIRLNFAAIDEKRIEIGIRTLGRLIRSDAHSAVA